MPTLKHALAIAAFIMFAAPVAQAQETPATPVATAPAKPAATAQPAPTAQPTAPSIQPVAAEPAAPPAPPPPPVLPPEVNATINSVVGAMDGAEKTLTAITNANTDLGKLRDDIDGVISKTTQTADGLRLRLTDIEEQIKRLGPPPAEGAPPEGATAAAARARLNAQLNEVSGAINTLKVTWWRARQAIDKITDLRL